MAEVTKVLGKADAGSCTHEIGTSAVSSNPAIAIALAKAWLEKAAASGEHGLTQAMLDKYLIRTGKPAAAACCIELPEGKAGTVTKERVPDAKIERIKRRPLRKMRPLDERIAAGNPKARERFLATNAQIDYLVDLQQDCLRQHKEKGYAEIGVDYTGAFKKVFILPSPDEAK